MVTDVDTPAPRRGRVLYVRDQGDLAARVAALTERIYQRTGERRSLAATTRRLLRAALDCPRILRQM